MNRATSLASLLAATALIVNLRVESAVAAAYSVADLGNLNGGSTFGVNANGQVTGFYIAANFSYQAFVRSGTTKYDLGTLGGSDGIAEAINVSGQMSGTAA